MSLVMSQLLFSDCLMFLNLLTFWQNASRTLFSLIVFMCSEEKLDNLRPRLRKFNMAARSVIWSHKLFSMGYKSTFFLARRFAKWNTFRTSYSWGGRKGLLPPPPFPLTVLRELELSRTITASNLWKFSKAKPCR